GDQASIIGGVVEFIKELQQLVQVLESKKRRKTLNRPSFPYDHQTLEPSILAAAATTTNTTTRVPFSRIENVMTTSTFKEVGACCNSPHANVEAKISGSNVIGLECHLSLEDLTLEVQKSFVPEVIVSTN
ncbi:hypothetical protein F2Q70_00009671, partial [Brassica cretica]